jgi:hypothetical protein
MNTWHGYPIDNDRHPTRPWWRQTSHPLEWERIDGRRVCGHPDGMALCDAEHPLPAPPPMVGQVWAWPDGCTVSVSYVRPALGSSAGFVCFGSPIALAPGCSQATTAMDLDEMPWPPPGAVLVDGPSQWSRHTQWAPMEEA